MRTAKLTKRFPFSVNLIKDVNDTKTHSGLAVIFFGREFFLALAKHHWRENHYALRTFLDVSAKLLPSVEASDAGRVRSLRCNEHDVVQRIAMKHRHRCKVFSQRVTVVPFQSLAELFDGFAGDLFCLLDFHGCPPVSGSSCSLHPTAREQGRETGDRSEEIGASRSERVARLSDTDFRGARDASGDRRRERLHAGTRHFRSGKNRRASEVQSYELRKLTERR